MNTSYRVILLIECFIVHLYTTIQIHLLYHSTGSKREARRAKYATTRHNPSSSCPDLLVLDCVGLKGIHAGAQVREAPRLSTQSSGMSSLRSRPSWEHVSSTAGDGEPDEDCNSPESSTGRKFVRWVGIEVMVVVRATTDEPWHSSSNKGPSIRKGMPETAPKN